MKAHGTTRRTSVRRPQRTWLVLAVALLVGVGIGLGPSLLRKSSPAASSALRVDRQRSVEALQLPDTGSPLSPAEVKRRLQLRATSATKGSTTPRGAVTAFLDAQVAARQDAAYSVLSDADRKRYPTAAVFALRRPQVIPDVIDYEIKPTDQQAHRATFAVHLRLRASLDETLGLIPADATAKIAVVHQHKSWRVALGTSDIKFQYLSTDELTSAAKQWIVARQRCESSQQWRSTLYGEGADSIARSLCKTTTDATFTGTGELAGRSDTAPLIAAFGPKVGIWARVVSVNAPKQFDLVLAPVGQQWLVIGLLTSPSDLVQG